MGSMEAATTIDNPVYDPDGDDPESAYVPSDMDRKEPAAEPIQNAYSQQMLILKEKPFDKKSLPHQVKFVRRKKITRQCVLIIALLLLVLIGLGTAIYFIAIKESKSGLYDPQTVEGQFRIVNRNFTPALRDPSTAAFQMMSRDLRQLLGDMFSADGSTILVSGVDVYEFRAGSIVVLYKLLLGEIYNGTYIEEKLEELFFVHVRTTKDHNLRLGDYIIERMSVSFKALLVTHTNGKTDQEWEISTSSLQPSYNGSSPSFATTPNVPPTSTQSVSPGATSLLTPLLTEPTGQTFTRWQPSVMEESRSTTEVAPRCEPITLEYCQDSSQVPYNEASFPNWLGHLTSEAAESSLWHWRPLMLRRCHPYLKRFICATLTPKCIQKESTVIRLPPCQQLCNEVLSKCTSVIFPPKEIIKCSDLPDSSDPAVCVGAPAISIYPLRLVGGLGPKEGQVQVYYNSSWGRICDTHWEDEEATVVCRQLNFRGKSKAYKNSYFGVPAIQTHFIKVRCSGSERHLALCNTEAGSSAWCNDEHAAGVMCDFDNRNVTLMIRLQGGATQSSGRLEVYYKNTWGTVCDDDFGEVEALVACRMLGYSYSGQVKSQANVADVTPASGPIWLKSVRCKGDETSLAQCSHHGWGIDMCSHSEDVYIECEQMPTHSTVSLQAPELNVRLVDGDQYSGRIEVMHYNKWGTVCWNLFTNKTAAVFCRTLGLSTQYATYEYNRYGPGTGPIWLSDIYCDGSEQTYLDCQHGNWGEVEGCRHMHDVSISCHPNLPASASDDLVESDTILKVNNVNNVGMTTVSVTPEKYATEAPQEMSARLVGEEAPLSGRIEVYLNGVWGTVCSHHFNDIAATVVCRMMGHNGTGVYLKEAHRTDDADLPIIMDNVDCVGREESIFNCTFWPTEEITCDHRLDAYIACLSFTGEDQVSVRLVLGEHDTEGYVEILHDGTWGTICKHGFGQKEASVTCNMMGYSGLASVLSTRELGEPRPMLLSGVQCTGDEKSLYDCTHSEWQDVADCDDWDDHVYVVCNGARQTPLRLVAVGDSVANQGRVELEIGGQWGTICHFDTSRETVLVLCRGLGYRNVTVDTVSVIEVTQPGVGPIWLSEVECKGSENDIRQCTHTGREKSEFSCSHDDDLIIRCGTGVH